MDHFELREVLGDISLYCNLVISMLGPITTVLIIAHKLWAWNSKKKQIAPGLSVSGHQDITDLSITTNQPTRSGTHFPIQRINESDLSLVRQDLSPIQQTQSDPLPLDSYATSSFTKEGMGNKAPKRRGEKKTHKSRKPTQDLCEIKDELDLHDGSNLPNQQHLGKSSTKGAN